MSTPGCLPQPPAQSRAHRSSVLPCCREVTHTQAHLSVALAHNAHLNRSYKEPTHPGSTWKLQPFTRTDIWLKNARPEVAVHDINGRNIRIIVSQSIAAIGTTFSNSSSVHVHLIGTNCGTFGALVEIKLFSKPRRCTVPSANAQMQSCESFVHNNMIGTRLEATEDVTSHLRQQPRCCLSSTKPNRTHAHSKHTVSSSPQ